MELGFQVAGLVVSAIVITAILGFLIEKSPESKDHAGREESHRS
jgi:hypothetical protein